MRDPNKFYNDQGQVAILYSPGYGAGWSTWNDDCLNTIFEPRLVLAVLENKTYPELCTIAEEIWGNRVYPGGLRDIEIMWLDPGTQFQITEYDGYESVDTNCFISWMIA